MTKITVTKPYMPPKKEFLSFVDEIWENQYLTNNGPLHRQFEQELLKMLHCNNLTLTVNGHMALDIAIKGMELEGEVITTPFTFASTVHALSLNHITPVFCDIKESDLTIDEDKIEALITEKTTAILPVHVYGHMCNLEKIEKIAKKHHLKVIYDAAHAFGVTYQGNSLAVNGDVSIFSFHATKIFNTIEGGALIYQDSDKKRIFEALKNFGIEGEEQIDFIGANAKMNEFQAAMGLVNLKHLEDLIQERKELTLYYREKLSKIKGISYFIPEKLYNNYQYNYAYFPILVKRGNRDSLYNYLKEKEIYSRKYFYPLITDFGCYQETYKGIDLPVAHKIGLQILCLPLYNGLSKKEIDFICETILAYYQGVDNYAKS